MPSSLLVWSDVERAPCSGVGLSDLMRATRSRLGVAIIGWLLFILSCVPSGYFQLGMYANRERRFDDAIHYYTLHLQQNPNDAEAYHNRALAYLYKGLFDSTLADCGRALALMPELAEAHHLCGLVSYYRRDYEAALAHFNKATELKVDLVETYCYRGRIYLTLGRHELAISDFSKAIVLWPGEAEAYDFRGEAHCGLGREERAIEDWRKAHELNPMYPIRPYARKLLGIKAANEE